MQNIVSKWSRKPFAYFKNCAKLNIHDVQIKNASNDGAIKMAFSARTSSTTDNNLPPLIIMHGLWGRRKNWRRISEHLSESTRRKIYTVDARNHGDSPHTPQHNSHLMSQDVLLLVRSEKLERVALLGHSMGGRTMMTFVGQNGSLVEKLIVVDISPFSMPRSVNEFYNIIDTLKGVNVPSNLSLAQGRREAKRQLSSNFHDVFIDFILMSFKKNKAGEFRWEMNLDGLRNSIKTFQKKAPHQKPTFSGPVLFVCGTESDYMNKEEWPQIKELYPSAEIEWLESGHLIHFERPKEFIESITSYLNPLQLVDEWAGQLAFVVADGVAPTQRIKIESAFPWEATEKCPVLEKASRCLASWHIMQYNSNVAVDMKNKMDIQVFNKLSKRYKGSEITETGQPNVLEAKMNEM